MGLFWDLIQQCQIADQESQLRNHSKSAASLETRIANLEQQLHAIQHRQHRLIQILENHFGQDLDGDGNIGG